MKRRGEVLERSFEHALDCGGARRTTLRGTENILKRYLMQTMGVNLSLLLRTMIGVGTVKQAIAASAEAITAFSSMIILVLDILSDQKRLGSAQELFSACLGRMFPHGTQPTSLAVIIG